MQPQGAGSWELPAAVGTPWTAHNFSLPAYPAAFTPQPQAQGQYAGSPQYGSPSPGSPSRQRLVITGADILIQPVPAIEPEAQAPPQDGPLAYYPAYAAVDSRHKWQRIRDWASQDSATATGRRPTPPGGVAGKAHGFSPRLDDSASHEDDIKSPADVTASIDSTLLELELARARASLKTLHVSAAGGIPAGDPAGARPGAYPGGVPAAAAIAAAAAAAVPPMHAMHASFAMPSGMSQTAASGSHTLRQELSFGNRPATSAGMAGPAPHMAPMRASTQQYAGAAADRLQPALTAMAEASTILGSGIATRPGTAGLLAASMQGAGGSMVHSLQQAHTSFLVERTALEARCRAAEESLAVADKRHAVEVERLHGRIATLESGLASERQLCSQVQEQLHAELGRLRTATEAEASARAAEQSTREMLEMTKQSLEAEKKRAGQAAQQAAKTGRESASKVASLEAQVASVQKELQNEKEQRARLARQLKDAHRQEQSLLDKLHTSEAGRQDQEMRLEAAMEQVDAMRSELQLLQAKLQARDAQLLKHVQDVEETQLQALRSDLAASQARVQQQEAMYSQLRGKLAAVHQVLAPQALASTFGYSEQHLQAFGAGPQQHAAIGERLLSQRLVSEEDAAAVVQRVNELVMQARSLYMQSERREVALTMEADQAVAALRQANSDVEARLTSTTTALRAATEQVEALANDLQAAKARNVQLDSMLQAAQRNAEAEREHTGSLQGELDNARTELSALRPQLAAAQSGLQELEASRDQVAALQAQVEHMAELVQRNQELAQAKEERIRELRGAVAEAMQGASMAEGQCSTLQHGKEEAESRALHAEAQLQEAEQQLDRVRAAADDAEAAYWQLSQQVAAAANEAVTQLRQLLPQHDAGAPPPLLLYATSQHLHAAQQEAAAALEAVEQAVQSNSHGRRALGIMGSPSQDAPLPSMRHEQLLASSQGNLPQTCAKMLLDHARQLALQQALVHQQLLSAQQHIRQASEALTPSDAAGTAAPGQQQLSLTALVEEVASAVATFAPAALTMRQAADSGSSAAGSLQQQLAQVQLLLAEAEQRNMAAEQRLAVAQQQHAAAAEDASRLLQQHAQRAEALQARLTECEQELESVKAAAQAEWSKLQEHVAQVLQGAHKSRDDAVAQADTRALAVEQRAAQQAADAASALSALQAELEDARATLASSAAEVQRLQDERVLGLRHMAVLQQQLQRQAEDLATLRRLAAPRARQRLLLSAKLRVTRRRRAHFQTLAATQQRRADRAEAAAAARAQRIKQGTAVLRQLRIDNLQLTARLSDAESKVSRADALLPRLEERRVALEADKKAQADKVARLTAQLADTTKAFETARKGEVAARKEVDRLLREQVEPQQSRLATLLTELEGAAAALQDSQANASRLLHEGESLRHELEVTQRQAEEDRVHAQQAHEAMARKLADQEALIRDLRRQLAAAHAAAEAAAALLPLAQSGQLGDLREHLIGQLGQLQATNVELVASKAAAEAELEVLRVRIGRLEASMSRPGTAAQVFVVPMAGPDGTPGPVNLAHLSAAAQGQWAARQQHQGPDEDASTVMSGVLKGMQEGNSAALATKDQRIHELRAALSSVLSERNNLQKELTTAKDAAATAATKAGQVAAEAEQQSAAAAQQAAQQIKQLQEELHQAVAAAEEAVKHAEDSAQTTVRRAEAAAEEAVRHAEAQLREVDAKKWDAERRAAEAEARCEERGRQVERLREQLAQVQGLHTSAEEAVRSLSAQLRDAQHATSGQTQQAAAAAQQAAAAAQQSQADADALRAELNQLKESFTAKTAEARRLQEQLDAVAGSSRGLSGQLQQAAEELSSARTRISVLQAELAELQKERDELRRGNEALQEELAAAEDRHVEAEAQLVDADASTSRQQALVRQLQGENERLHQQYTELHTQLQTIVQERERQASAPMQPPQPQFIFTGGSPPDSPGAAPSSPGASVLLSSPAPASARSPSMAAAKRRNLLASPADSTVTATAAALESKLLEGAVEQLQKQVQELQVEAARKGAAAQQALQQAELLRLDLAAATGRARAAESQVADLQQRLTAATSGASTGAGALRERVLELEVTLGEEQDRTQVTQEALQRANARVDELQQLLEATERKAGDLEAQAGDYELEIGLLRAQMAAAQAQVLTMQAEQQQAPRPTPGDSRTGAVLEHVQAQMEGLQRDLRAATNRAEAAEKSVSELQMAVTVAHGDMANTERQLAAAEARLRSGSEADGYLRAEAGKLSARLAECEGELLLCQEARDTAVSSARTAAARLADEQAECASLRKQLSAATSSGSSADTAWLQRVQDLEHALADARLQAARAGDAASEAAVARSRAEALEGRLRELQSSAASREQEAQASLREATDAAAQAAAQAQAHQQEVLRLQGQVRESTAKLGVVQQQVADRDGRLSAYADQVAVLQAQLKEMGEELRKAKTLQREATTSRMSLERRLSRLQEDTADSVTGPDAISVSGMSLVSTQHQHQLVGMLSENKDLLDKLTVTHSKLKQTRAKLAQREQELLSLQAEVHLLRKRNGDKPGTPQPGRATVSDVAVVQALKAEVEAYKAALSASQEEATASAAAAAEAQARCDALQLRVQQDAERRSSHSQAGMRVASASSPGMLEQLLQQNAGSDYGPTSEDVRVLSQKLRSQRSEIDVLSSELEAANAKRAEAAKQVTMLAQRLLESEIKERELASTVETLRQQLALVQQQLVSRQAMIQQLTTARNGSYGGTRGGSAPDSPTSSIMRSLGWHGADASHADDTSFAASPRSQATQAYHTTHTLSPAKALSMAAAGLPGKGGLPSQPQQPSKLDRVVAMWKDACRAKDTQVQALQEDLSTFSSQLERARADVTGLTGKVLQRDQALASSQQQMLLMQESLSAQLQAADDKLRAKAAQLDEAEDAIAQKDSELKAARSQLQATQRALLALQSQGSAHESQAQAAAQSLESLQQRVLQLEQALQDATRNATGARADADQVSAQVRPLQEQLARAESHVLRLMAAMRSALAAAGITSAGGRQAAAVAAALNGPHVSDGGASSSGIHVSLGLLGEVVGALSEELAARSSALAEASSKASQAEAQLAAKEEEVKLLSGKLRSVQEALQARSDEVSKLQGTLRRKEVDYEAVEAEIQQQIQDYQRLKQKLMQQERDSVRLASDQDSVLQRCDDLQNALSAKQEECALMVRKASQLEEQLQAGQAATAALQERVRLLESQADSLSRTSQQAMLHKHEAASGLESARSELRAAQQQLATYQQQLEKRNTEIRELNSMLKAWEAMRLGKDAQIAALMERCKRHEEDAAEKARTVEALRRKLQAVVAARGMASTAAAAGGAAGVAPSAAAAATPAMSGPSPPASQYAAPGYTYSAGTRHIHVHMHSPATGSPTMSGSGSNLTGPVSGR